MNQRVARVAALYAQGWDKAAVEAAINDGILTRIARGWIAHHTAHPWVVGAIRAGGRLGCLSACSLHGLWTPYHRDPHVIIDRGVRNIRPEWHRHPSRLPEEAVFPLIDSLAQVIKHHSVEDALTVLESAVNQGRIGHSAAETLISSASRRKQQGLKFFDPGAQSGSETRLRFWLQQHRVKVRAQVSIPGVGRVDLLVGASLIIECDSREHHAFTEEDYRRDMEARALGYTIVRLSFRQLFLEWEETQEYLMRLLRTRRHLRAPAPH